MPANGSKGMAKRLGASPIGTFSIALLCLLAFPLNVAAHKVYLFAWVEG